MHSLFIIAPLFVRVYIRFLICNAAFCVISPGEERAGCFTFIVFLISPSCYRPLPLPHGAIGLSAAVTVAFLVYTHFLK